MVSCHHKEDTLLIKEIDSLIEEAKISELSNIEKMKSLSDSIKILSEKNNYNNGLAYYHFFEAKYQRSQMEITEALNHLLISKRLFRKSNDKIGEGLTVNEILMNVKFTEEKEFPQLPDYKEDTSNIIKLIKIEYQAHIPLDLSNRDNLDSLSIFVTLIDNISKIRPGNEYEKMKENHLLAKINYAIGRIYRKADSTDLALTYFKKSAYYDTLLHSRQPWSMFTVATVYIDKFKKDTTNTQLLDSIQKYNYLSLYVLNKYVHFKEDSTYSVNSDTMYNIFKRIINEGFYYRQLASIGKNILEYEILTQKKDKNILKYNSQSDSLFQTVTAVSSNYYMLQGKKEKQKSTNFKIFVILLVIIVLISVFVIYIYIIKNSKIKKLSEKLRFANEQLSKEKNNLNKINIELEREKNKYKNAFEELEIEKMTVQEINENLSLGNIVAESISHTVGHLSNLTIFNGSLNLENEKILLDSIKDLRVRLPYVVAANKFYKAYKKIKKDIEDNSYLIGEILEFDALIENTNLNIDFIKDINDFSPFKSRPILEQIIYNIVHNSIKQFEIDTIHEKLNTIGIKPFIKIRTYNDNLYNIIEIEDNGGGIDNSFLKGNNTLNIEKIKERKSSGLYLIHKFCEFIDVKYEYYIINNNNNFGTLVKLYI